MEDLDDNISSTGFEHLFIKEEDVDPDRNLVEQPEGNMAKSALIFTGAQLSPSALMKPYLQEMDDLLKSCEELTGIHFGSHFSASYKEESMTESAQSHFREEAHMKSYGETSISPQAYLSTSYIDTHMDGVGTVDQPPQGQPGTISSKDSVKTQVSCQREMPLTSVGHKLSDTMVEYEGQLMGMLAMLDKCMDEAGMDFEPQDWATDASQEYVHISKNTRLCKGTTLVPIQSTLTQGRPVKLETEAMQLESWADQQVQEREVSKENKHEVTMTIDSATNGGQQTPVLSNDDMEGFLMETLDREEKLKTDQAGLSPLFRFSGPSVQLHSAENDSMYCEPTNVSAHTCTMADVTGIEMHTELPAEERQEPKMDTTEVASSGNELAALGSHMEQCIEEVQQLEKQRKELLAEILELRGNKDREETEGGKEDKYQIDETIDRKVAELMNTLKKEEQERQEERKREIQSFREERAEEERRIWKMNLERHGLQEELRKLKRRLFAMARECAHNQVALNTQHRDVEQLKREEEKLQSLVLQLTEEASQLRSVQQQKLLDLRAEFHAQSSGQNLNTQDELTQYKRNSCGDIQQYLQGGLRALEERYEPILLALLKRREVTTGALVKVREQAQELKVQLRPLKEEVEKLKLQKTCLEEKLKLIHMHRREDVGQYKETVSCLEESSRELKAEIKIQKRKTKDMEELRASLTKRLLLYRAAIEDHNRCDEEKT